MLKQKGLLTLEIVSSEIQFKERGKLFEGVKTSQSFYNRQFRHQHTHLAPRKLSDHLCKTQLLKTIQQFRTVEKQRKMMGTERSCVDVLILWTIISHDAISRFLLMSLFITVSPLFRVIMLTNQRLHSPEDSRTL